MNKKLLSLTEAMEIVKERKPIPASKRIAEFGISVYDIDNTDEMWKAKEQQ